MHTFHIQIAPHHREGMAYQYMILPFGLSLARRTFTKCMDAALSPLRQMENRIPNDLDDRLILARSEDELLSQRFILLSHLWRSSTHGMARFCTARYGMARLSLGRFVFPPQFSTALEWAGLFTCRYSCAASTAVTSS